MQLVAFIYLLATIRKRNRKTVCLENLWDIKPEATISNTNSI